MNGYKIVEVENIKVYQFISTDYVHNKLVFYPAKPLLSVRQEPHLEGLIKHFCSYFLYPYPLWSNSIWEEKSSMLSKQLSFLCFLM